MNSVDAYNLQGIIVLVLINAFLLGCVVWSLLSSSRPARTSRWFLLVSLLLVAVLSYVLTRS